MARKNGTVAPHRSPRTGFYWPCQSNRAGVHPQPVGVSLRLGKSGVVFYRCNCGDNHFFAIEFRPEHGYSADEIVGMGLVAS